MKTIFDDVDALTREKARADALGASLREHSQARFVAESALAAARRECERLKEKMAELASALSETADDIDSRDVEGFREALREGAAALTDAVVDPAATEATV